MKAKQFSRWTEEEKNVVRNQIRNNVKPNKAIKTVGKELKTRSYSSILGMYYNLRAELSKQMSEKTVDSPVIKTFKTDGDNTTVDVTSSPYIKVEFNKDCVTVYFPTI